MTDKDAKEIAYLEKRVADDIIQGAPGLLQQRHPRVDDDLLEEPDVLRGSVVVDAVDHFPAEDGADAAEQTVHDARRVERTAVWRKRSRAIAPANVLFGWAVDDHYSTAQGRGRIVLRCLRQATSTTFAQGVDRKKLT